MIHVISSLFLCCAGVVAILLSGVRLCRVGTRSAGSVYLSATTTCGGVSIVLAAPAVVEALAAVDPFGFFTRLVPNSIAMGGGFFLQAMLLHAVCEPGRARRYLRWHLLVLVLAVAAMTVLLATADVRAEPDFVAVYAPKSALVVGYLVLYATYLAATLISLILLLRRYKRYTNRPWLRRSQTVVQVAAVFGVAYTAAKATFAIAAFVTGQHLAAETAVAAVLASACASLLAIGVALPRWGPALARPVQRARHRRAYRRLRPLWEPLRAAIPEIGRDLVELHVADEDIATALTRRVTEIQDGMLMLAPYRPDHGDSPAPQRHNTAAAIEEAAQIMRALRAWHAGAAPAVQSPPPPAQDAEWEREIAWLVRVAQAVRRSGAALGDFAVLDREEYSDR